MLQAFFIANPSTSSSKKFNFGAATGAPSSFFTATAAGKSEGAVAPATLGITTASDYLRLRNC